MSSLATIKTQIQTLITLANDKTGKSDTTLTDCVNSLIAGYGTSGDTGGDTGGGDSTLTQGDITSEVTWQTDTRLSSSSINYSAQSGVSASSDIAVQNGDIIRIYGMTQWRNYAYVNIYGATPNLLHNADLLNSTSIANNYTDIVVDENNVLTITVKHADVSFIRVANGTDNFGNVRISRNAELNTHALPQGDITNEVTFTTGKRYSTSSGTLKDATNNMSTSHIQAESGDIIRIKGMQFTETASGNCCIVAFDSSDTFISSSGTYLFQGQTKTANSNGNYEVFLDSTDEVRIINHNGATVSFGLTGVGTNTAGIKVTRNAEITNEDDSPTSINLLPTDTSGYTINTKYSGNTTVAGNGRYLTPVISVDLNATPYLNVSGLYNGASGVKPFLYKIGFYKGSTLTQVTYFNNWGAEDTPTGKSVNILAKGDYNVYDGVQLEICASGSAITTSDIITDGSITATLSATAEY